MTWEDLSSEVDEMFSELSRWDMRHVDESCAAYAEVKRALNAAYYSENSARLRAASKARYDRLVATDEGRALLRSQANQRRARKATDPAEYKKFLERKRKSYRRWWEKLQADPEKLAAFQERKRARARMCRAVAA